jgi:hypothetical protein
MRWGTGDFKSYSQLHCLLQGFRGQLRSPGIGTLAKALTTHQTHKCVLPSLPRARALKESQDLSHWDQGTNCGHFDKGAPTEHLLWTSQVHVWTVTQDALVRECEVECTTTLTLQPFLEGESVLLYFWSKIVSPPFLAVSLLWFHMTRTYYIKHVLTKEFSESRTLIVPQNLNIMAPELPMQRSLLSVERRTNLRLVKPKSS